MCYSRINTRTRTTRETRNKVEEIFDKSVPEKKTPKPLNVLHMEREIRSKRKYEKVPIVNNLKNKGVKKSVKE